ncbi:MAG: carboxylesterase family protein [Spirochaetales bacterium]|nr:carboxylesterase family protein [Spirochaetales bacterium]
MIKKMKINAKGYQVLLLTLAVFITGCQSTDNQKQPMTNDDTVTIDTPLGSVTGLKEEGLQIFLGLPYAQPPVDELRWMPPKPLNEKYEDLRATEYPDRAYGTPYLDALAGRDIPGDFNEDCLYLNIYTPAADKSRRPVMFWIHGGAFIQGSANEYSGSAIARENDVVVVAVNYRLGPLGFLDMSSFGDEYEGSGSLGLQDQISALCWVKDNIAAYGGDPGNVTIFGESAGGASVLALLAAPSAEGLFHKAIASSPGEISGTPTNNIPVLESLFDAEGEELLSILRQTSAADLVDLQVSGLISTGGAIDGKILPVLPSRAILANKDKGVPLLIGNNKEEGTFLVDAIPPESYDIMTYIYGISIADGDPSEYIAALNDLVPEGSPRDRMIRVWYDYFRASGLRAAQNSTIAGVGGWNYSFEVPGNTPFGTTHGSDLAFVFNALNHQGDMIFPTWHEASDDNKELARKWSATLAHFARTGNPNGSGFPEWPQYSPDSRKTLVIDIESEVVEDLDGPGILSLYNMD